MIYINQRKNIESTELLTQSNVRHSHYTLKFQTKNYLYISTSETLLSANFTHHYLKLYSKYQICMYMQISLEKTTHNIR